MEVEIPVGSIARLTPPEGTTATHIDNEVIPVSNDAFRLNSGKYFVEYFLRIN